MIKPNTFIIGAQKSATTSLYNWIAQHSDVCGPNSLKDFPFFFNDEYFNKGLESLQKEYIKANYHNQKIIMQGYVNYMFYESAIVKIHNFDPQSKLICILRNPTERAVSAYNYFKKLNLESLSFEDALQSEEVRQNGTQREQNNLTYKAHGLYAKQLEHIYTLFKKNQVLVLLYEDLKEAPNKELKKIFKFLEIDTNVKIDTKNLNITGDTKYKSLNNLLYNENKIKKFFIKNLVDPFFPLHRRIDLKLAILSWNTNKRKSKSPKIDYFNEKKKLNEFFKTDIEKLEKLIERDLDHWK